MPFIVKWDWLLKIASKINGFEVTGVEYIPFIVVVNNKENKVLINHETIHFWQMLETLFVGYYLIYIFHYLYLRIYYKHIDAYKKICLEKEAYKNQNNLVYIKNRKIFNWAR